MDFEGNSMMEAAGQLGFDLEGSFEPQQRARSNTWPCPRPESFVEGTPGCPGKDGASGTTPPHPPSAAGLLQPVKKNSSRRNAWGNLSYADLITQAITSAPDKRLTLSQIYEWMVQNVPYFKDKGDSNSSAGWKNSIRHNLSLHNRFMRVQNEGTGKSSWWMINPDAKPGKSARRRATSMETSKFEKRRGRVKKKVEALRNGGLPPADATPSPSSSVSEGLDLFPDSPLHTNTSFQLSPDFRPRASSNASSCGRLSPIPSVISESDWTPNYTSSYSPAEQLAGNLAETMKLDPATFQMYQTSLSNQSQQQAQPPQPHQSSPQVQQQQQQSQPTQQQPQVTQQAQQSAPPPSYFEAQYQRSSALRNSGPLYGLQTNVPQATTPPRCPIHRVQRCTCQIQSSMNLGTAMSPSYASTDSNSSLVSQQQQQQSLQQFLMQQQVEQTQQHSPAQPQVQGQVQSPQQSQTTPPGSPIPSTMMGQLMGALNNAALLDDLNINIENLQGFDCDIDEVIKHELLINGTLDINFQQNTLGPHSLDPANTVSNCDNPVAGLGLDQLGTGLDGGVTHGHLLGGHHQTTTAAVAGGAASAAVYASTNPANQTPSATAAATASPSWVH